MGRRGVIAVAGVVLLSTVAPSAQATGPAVCRPGGPAVTFAGTATPADARTYLALPFEVDAGVTRVEVTYDWTDAAAPLPSGLNANVFDLGLWDGDGLGTPAGFRGWSGSRAGRRSGQPPVFVQQDVAQRGYRPAPIEPGTWHVDLGVAAIDPLGTSSWDVEVVCSAPPVGPPFVADPVDPAHVARTGTAWYHGDFHMHGFHSNLAAPSWADMVAEATSRGLDFLPITDYVTSQHWDELGAVQRANPATLLIPGREIITYFGHANAIGETPSVLDYRHGFAGVTLRDIQAATLADGALFQVNHPTLFPGPVFANFCRGCEFTLDDGIDWDQVDTYEVLTGPARVSAAELGLPELGVQGPNPFLVTALLEWQDLLRRGHRITAVSGSDSKGVEDDARRRWGTSATAVYAEGLCRASVFAAVRAGHAYIRTLGVAASPTLEVTAAAPDGGTAMMGDTVVADEAPLTATVTGASGQVLLLTRDGLPWGAPVPVTSDPFITTWTADRLATSGPLGTFWRVDVADAADPALLTAIGNPIFLAATPAPLVEEAACAPSNAADPLAGAPAAATAGALPAAAGALPATGGGPASPPFSAALAVVAALGARLVGRSWGSRRSHRPHRSPKAR